MTNNKQQTAVEFIMDLIQKRIDRNYERCLQGLPDDHCRGYLYKLLEECNEAKEMEKKQIINSFWNGDNTDCTSEQNIEEFAEQYYNETYGGGEQ